jgi:hypothetical protein
MYVAPPTIPAPKSAEGHAFLIMVGFLSAAKHTGNADKKEKSSNVNFFRFRKR